MIHSQLVLTVRRLHLRSWRWNPTRRGPGERAALDSDLTHQAPLGAFLNIFSYWGLALPLAFVFAFGPTQLGLVGLWAGLSIGLFLSAIGTVFIFLRLDFDQEAENARLRMIDGDGKDEEAAPLFSH